MKDEIEEKREKKGNKKGEEKRNDWEKNKGIRSLSRFFHNINRDRSFYISSLDSSRATLHRDRTTAYKIKVDQGCCLLVSLVPPAYSVSVPDSLAAAAHESDKQTSIH